MQYNLIVNGSSRKMNTEDIRIRLQEVEKADHDSYWVQHGLFSDEVSTASKCLWVMLCCLCCKNACFTNRLEETCKILLGLKTQIDKDPDPKIKQLYTRAMRNFYEQFRPSKVAGRPGTPRPAVAAIDLMLPPATHRGNLLNKEVEKKEAGKQRSIKIYPGKALSTSDSPDKSNSKAIQDRKQTQNNELTLSGAPTTA